MKTTLRALWMPAVVGAGIVAAACAALYYGGTAVFSKTFWQHALAGQHQDLANACPVPNEASDEIFFISCGGIY